MKWKLFGFSLIFLLAVFLLLAATEAQLAGLVAALGVVGFFLGLFNLFFKKHV